MNQLIERYIADVARRLPERDREEVIRELRANLYDMLPEDAGEDAVKEVLYGLGPPAALAERYRANPRYLIGPALYEDYLRVLRWVLPLVGGVLLVVGMVLGGLDAAKAGAPEISVMIRDIVSTGFSMGFSSVFQVLMWVTAGFAIAERTGAKGGVSRPWRVEDLPPIQPDSRGRIPLSDSIIHLVFTVFFAAVALSVCTGALPVAFLLLDGQTQVHTLFSSTFLRACIPAIVLLALLGVVEGTLKIRVRRWTPAVCAAVVAGDFVGIVVFLSLLRRPDLFSQEFTAFLQRVDWGDVPLRLMGGSGPGMILTFFAAVVVVASLVEAGQAIYKTVLYRRP